MTGLLDQIQAETGPISEKDKAMMARVGQKIVNEAYGDQTGLAIPTVEVNRIAGETFQVFQNSLSSTAMPAGELASHMIDRIKQLLPPEQAAAFDNDAIAPGTEAYNNLISQIQFLREEVAHFEKSHMPTGKGDPKEWLITALEGIIHVACNKKSFDESKPLSVGLHLFNSAPKR